MVGNNELFENAEVRFRNFRGAEGPFNSEGDRGFTLILDPERAKDLEAKGWTIKTTKPDENDEFKYFTRIKVKYNNYPPRVFLITSKGRLEMTEDEIGLLDGMDVANWDLVINPSNWEFNGNKGVKGYLKQAFVTMDENEFELKYMNLPDANPTTNLPNTTVNDEDLEVA